MKIQYLLFAFLVLATACSKELSKTDIFVSVPPQKYFVEKIVGNTKTVKSLLGSSDNPENFEISLQDIRNLEKADIFFAIGVPYENNMTYLFDDDTQTVRIENMAALAEYRPWLEDEDEHGHEDEHAIEHEDEHGHEDEHAHEDEHEHEDEDEHAHEDEHEHAHGEFDPHIWLSIANAPRLAEHTYNVLVAQYPELSNEFKNNYESLLQDIEKIQEQSNLALQKYKGAMYLMYHPAFGYIADEFSLQQVSIQAKSGENSIRHIKELVDIAKENNIHTVFIQAGFPEELARSVAQKIGATIQFVSPLDEPWDVNILNIIDALVKSFETAQ